MLKVEDLLGKGYFPKELPPPFASNNFSSKYQSISSLWSSAYDSLSKTERKLYKDSRCLGFSIPKVGFSRRQISVPNPLHQSILSNSISQNWDEIKAIYSRSSLTASMPIIDSKGSRSVKNKNSYKEFRKTCILNSYAHLYFMKTDVSRYYSTIYTHIIPWAFYGKPEAKEKRNDYSLLGNILDRDVRNTQSGQTMGIPIGPDTSLMISEIIACKIDEELVERLGELNGKRYFDDYFLFFSDYAQAENALKCLQSIFAAYNLDINEEKTNIEKFPIAFENSWSMVLGKFELRGDRAGKQSIDLYQYFSLAFEHARLFPNDSVLKYAIKRLENIQIFSENWKTLERLLLKSALVEPAILPEVAKILISNEPYVSKNRIRKLAQEVICVHCFKVHSFEVSWALWILRSFNITLDDHLANKVIESGDPISILILLDMRNLRLVSGDLDTSSLQLELTSESLFDEKWLLNYESVKKGWLHQPNLDLFDSNAYFGVLAKENVEFYMGDNQLEKIDFDKKSGSNGDGEPYGDQKEPEISFEEDFLAEDLDMFDLY